MSPLSGAAQVSSAPKAAGQQTQPEILPLARGVRVAAQQSPAQERGGKDDRRLRDAS